LAAAAIDAAGVVISLRAQGCCALVEDRDPAFESDQRGAAACERVVRRAGEWSELSDAWRASVFLPLTRLDETDPFPAALSLDVLVAEDDAGARTLLKAVLESLGIGRTWPRTARKPPRRRACAGSISWMDIQMPGVNGLDAARAIRAMSGSGADLAIVALTSLNTEKMREQVVEAGMDAFLSKPLEIPRLAETLALLAKRRLVDAALGD
jgi:CheY-like chemotaxis protein